MTKKNIKINLLGFKCPLPVLKANHLIKQIEAGAEVIQIFDSHSKIAININQFNYIQLNLGYESIKFTNQLHYRKLSNKLTNLIGDLDFSDEV